MLRTAKVTALLIALALMWSAALSVLIFFVHIPVRPGSHRLIETGSGGLKEVRFLPQTYFEAYGAAELVLTGVGLIASAIVAVVFYRRHRNHQRDPGKVAWGLAVGAMVIGIAGVLTAAHSTLLVGILLLLACLSFSSRRVSPGTSSLPEQSPCH